MCGCRLGKGRLGIVDVDWAALGFMGLWLLTIVLLMGTGR